MESGLLAQIQRGKALKKSQTNDRSAPVVTASKPSGGPSSSGMARPPIPGMAAPPMPGMGGSLAPTSQHTASVPSAGPQLGGLFANGMPTLRKTRGSAVDTGRGAAAPTPPPAPPSSTPNMPPPTPGRSPAFNSKPPTMSSHNTLPRNFKAPPPIPGRALPQFNSPSSISSASPPPPPPPPPPGGGIAPGVSPKIQASLVPPVPGRSRSNSSPQRPVPPPPSPGPAATIPSQLNQQQRSSPVATPPRSPLPPPPAPIVTPGRTFGNNTSPPPPGGGLSNNNRPSPPSFRAPSVPTPPQTNNGFNRPPPPPCGPTPLMGLRLSPLQQQQVLLTEGGDRYTFRPTSDLPAPRSIHISRRVYPSGENKGNAYPLDYSRLR